MTAKDKKSKSFMKSFLKTIITVVAVLLAIMIVLQCVGFGALFGLYEPKRTGKYADELESYGVFDNTYDEALPQTVIYKIIMDHFNAPLAEGKTVKKAIFLGFDGFRADGIKNIKDDPESAIMYVKNLGGLYHTFAGGIKGEREQHTSTAPGWCSMLTGGWAEYHGISNNGMSKNDKETCLTALAKQGHASSFTVSWREHTSISYKPDIQLAIKNGLPIEYNHEIDDMATYYQVLKYVSKPADARKTAAEDPDMIFFTFEFTDHAGHFFGFGNNKNYYNATLDANKYGYDIIKTIESRSTYAQEDWLIVISTDHGGTGHNHGGQSIMERSTWLAVNKKLDITPDLLTFENK